MHFIKSVLLVFLILFAPSTFASSLYPGSLDPSFGINGFASSPVIPGDGYGVPRALAVLPDGGFIVAGVADEQGETHTLLIKYNADGSLDPQFGNGGVKIINFSVIQDSRKPETIRYDSAFSILLQKDDKGELKILIAGVSENLCFNHDFYLARFDLKGNLDLEFAKNNQKIWGSISDPNRVLSNNKSGVIFINFHPNPFFSCEPFNLNDRRPVIAFQDKKIVLAGTSEFYHPKNQLDPNDQTVHESSLVFIRFDSEGNLDRSFGNQGSFSASFGNGVYSGLDSLIVQKDKKILVGGKLEKDFKLGNKEVQTTKALLMRLTEEGSSLDKSFGTDGVFTWGNSDSEIINLQSILLQGEDEKIIAGGNISKFDKSGYTNPSDFILFRCSKDCKTLDSTFAHQGVQITNIYLDPNTKTLNSPFSNDTLQNLFFQNDGKIIAVGMAGSAYFRKLMQTYAVVRYDPNGNLDTSFNYQNHGEVPTEDKTVFLELWESPVGAMLADGKILVAGIYEKRMEFGKPGKVDVTLARYITGESDLQLVVSSSEQQGNTGQQLDYTFTVLNKGGELAKTTELSMTLPDTLGLVSIRSSQGECKGATQIYCDLKSIQKDGNVFIYLSVKIKQTGEIKWESEVAVKEQTGDPNLTNNKVSLVINKQLNQNTSSSENGGGCSINSHDSKNLLFSTFFWGASVLFLLAMLRKRRGIN